MKVIINVHTNDNYVYVSSRHVSLTRYNSKCTGNSMVKTLR